MEQACLLGVADLLRLRRSLLLWTLWFFAAICGFAWKYLSLGPDAFDHPYLSEWNWATAIYYSMATFASAGHFGIAPATPEAAGWVSAEVTAGYVMLAGLVSILFSRLARRSWSL